MEEKKRKISIIEKMPLETEFLDQSLNQKREKIKEVLAEQQEGNEFAGIRLNEEYVASQIRLRGLSSDAEIIEVDEDDERVQRPYNENVRRREGD